MRSAFVLQYLVLMIGAACVSGSLLKGKNQDTDCLHTQYSAIGKQFAGNCSQILLGHELPYDNFGAYGPTPVMVDNSPSDKQLQHHDCQCEAVIKATEDCKTCLKNEDQKIDAIIARCKGEPIPTSTTSNYPGPSASHDNNDDDGDSAANTIDLKYGTMVIIGLAAGVSALL